ncbi:MAG: O-antigen ligase family protein [Clostridiales bacterium]|jgi:O-antigen ligase|nr:O-antigen ligase family protein [Clostridiales bacterium]
MNSKIRIIKSIYHKSKTYCYLKEIKSIIITSLFYKILFNNSAVDIFFENSFLRKIFNFKKNKSKQKTELKFDNFFLTRFFAFLVVFFVALIKTKFITLLILITIIIFFLEIIFKDKKLELKFNLIDISIVFFLVNLLLSSIFVFKIKQSLKVFFIYLVFIAFYFVLKNVLRTKKDLLNILRFLVASGFIVSIIGISQKFFNLVISPGAWIDEKVFSENTTRIFSTLDNPNVLGEFLIFVIPLNITLIYLSKKIKEKILLLLVLFSLLLCMLLTLSRGAWLGLILSLLIFFLFCDKKIFLLILCFLFASPIFIPKSFVDRFVSILSAKDSSSHYRINIWLSCLIMLKDFWLCGIGLGFDNFIFIFKKYAMSASYALHSHNLYLEIFLEMGFSGIILFLLILFFCLKKLVSTDKFSSDKSLFFLKIALLSGIIGFMIQGLADNSFYSYKLICIFFVILALSNIRNEMLKLSIWKKFRLLQREYNLK